MSVVAYSFFFFTKRGIDGKSVCECFDVKEVFSFCCGDGSWVVSWEVGSEEWVFFDMWVMEVGDVSDLLGVRFFFYSRGG